MAVLEHSETDKDKAGHRKLHGRTFYESLGSPRMILAPMVDQSEFVRPLTRCSQVLTGGFRPGVCSLDLSWLQKSAARS